jgi:hypothetical protein
MLKDLFADEVHRSTYDKRFVKLGLQTEDVLRRFRMMLRHAQRFVLDDDAVRIACALSLNRRRLDLWSVLARLPYDAVWIEFDLQTKLKEWERYGTLLSPLDHHADARKCGYLMHRDVGSSTRWIAQEYSSVSPDVIPLPASVAKPGDILALPSAFVFDPNGDELNPVTGSTTWKSLTLSAQGFPTVPMHITSRHEHIHRYSHEASIEQAFAGDVRVVNEDPLEIVPGPWTQHKVGIIPSPAWTHMTKKRLWGNIAADAKERIGVLRWLVTALAMINDVPKTTKLIKGRPGRMVARMHSLNYFDHHIVSINVPKGSGVRYAERALNRQAVQAHRKRHSVRGHWRVIEYGKRFPVLCTHEPVEIDGDYALCQRCERLIRWIPNHHRGDARLGFVKHDYLVEA